MITALPTPPQRSDSANFAARADAFLTALPTFGVEANALASDVNSKQSLATSAANTATTQAGIATTAANTATTKANEASTSASNALTYAQAAQVSSGVPTPIANRVLSTDSSGNITWRDLGLDPATWQNLPTLRPSLLLDFANSRSIDPRLNFTRAGAATRTNERGLIETVASNIPRIDFDTVSGACRGLLIEEQRTNLLTYSEQFDNAAWVKLRSSVTTNATGSPDGTLTADKLVEDTTTSNTHYAAQVISVSASTAYIFTVYLKAAERTLANVLIDGTSGNFSNAYVDLSAGTVISGGANGTFTGYSSSMTLVGNGWYRLTLTSTVGAGTTSLQCQIRLSNNGIEAYTGDGSSGIYAWGAQLEAGGFPTSYIPTTSAAATRAADVASMTGTNFSEWFKPLEGTFVFTGSIAAISTTAIQEYYLLSASDGASDNHVALRGFSGPGLGAGTFRVDARCVTASVEQAGTAEVVVAVNSTFTTAVSFKANDLTSSTNASTPSTDTSVTLPVVNALYLGASPNGVPSTCHIKRTAYYPKRLSNAELQALTTP